MAGKIGIGIITCNRQELYLKCLASVENANNYDYLVVVNDGKEYTHDRTSKGGYNYIQNKENLGVGKSKNKAIKDILKNGCEHIFLIEDDIIIKSKHVFAEYIKHSQKTGLMHLSFGYHGEGNKIGGNPGPRNIIEYGNDIKIALNRHCVGAFCYYHSSVIKKIGLFDEKYKNAWEHVDHSYKATKENIIPGYWWWPDVADSYKLLQESSPADETSAIRSDPNWPQDMSRGAAYFKLKHSHTPVEVPDSSLSEITTKLKLIYNNHSHDIEKRV